jgi:hypothetical protein
MHTRIIGFSQQTILSEEQVKAAFLRVPVSHRKTIQVIRYDPLRMIATAMNHLSDHPVPGSVRGVFYQSEHLSAIVIWRFDSAHEFRHILYHEIGHFVFRNILPQAVRNEWMYGVRSRELKTVSEYACKNSREDFAECYAFWMTQRPEILSCPERNKFFSHTVFQSQ